MYQCKGGYEMHNLAKNYFVLAWSSQKPNRVWQSEMENISLGELIVYQIWLQNFNPEGLVFIMMWEFSRFLLLCYLLIKILLIRVKFPYFLCWQPGFFFTFIYGLFPLSFSICILVLNIERYQLPSFATKIRRCLGDLNSRIRMSFMLTCSSWLFTLLVG